MSRNKALFQTATEVFTHTIPRLCYPVGINRLDRLDRLVSRIRSSRSQNSVFIWIPQTAGTAIWTTLNNSHCPKLKDPYAVRHCFCNHGMVTFGHQSYRGLKKTGYVKQSFDDSSYEFCFVRNPYDRAVSSFHYFKKHGVFHANLTFTTFCYILRDGAFDPVGPVLRRAVSWLPQPMKRLITISRVKIQQRILRCRIHFGLNSDKEIYRLFDPTSD